MLFSRAENLINLGREHHEVYFYEIILNLDKWFRRRRSLTIFLISSSGGPFVQRSETICVILVEGTMRHISVNFF